jgi:DNA-directed RNA polymerase subunit beta
MSKINANSISPAKREKKYFSRYKKPLVETPNLLETQVESFKWLVETGIKEIFKEFSPIKDYSEKKFELSFDSYFIAEPKHDEYYAKVNKLTYEAPLKVQVTLKNKTIGSEKKQELFMSDFPLMTERGTFIVNGVERVIVPQLTRSSGVFFTSQEVKGKTTFGAKIIPARGVWMEIETDKDGLTYVRIDKKRKFAVTALLRFFGLDTDAEIEKMFKGNKVHEAAIKLNLESDDDKTPDEAYVAIYKRLRDGDMATPENAKGFLEVLFNSERYDFSAVGRFRFNKRFEKDMSDKEMDRRTLSQDDIVTIVKNIFTLNADSKATADDIDHLGSRRVRYVGELMQMKFRTGIAQIKRNIQDRMSTIDADTALPVHIVNQRPLQARIKEFFTTNQLSQFMDQENVLSEIEHLRLLTALGPGGLTRERASIEVRDVHTSHYGRVCPIHTPEGPNIGLVLHLATYARPNHFGIIETPYAVVKKGKITKEIIYLNGLEEEKYNIAHASTPYDDKGNITVDFAESRAKAVPGLVAKDNLDFIDIAQTQAFSLATSMIPFLEHDDANRALMGSNMQKQGVPLLVPEAPIVSTGMEKIVAHDSGRIILAKEAGKVTYSDSTKVVVKGKTKEETYNLIQGIRTAKSSLLRQRPSVKAGETVKRGDVLADTSSTEGGQAALGQNALVAFMAWNGQNYEDAIIISQRLVKDSKFTSIYVEEHTCLVRDTKLGPESTTRDIPNVGELKLKDLDEDGIIRIGAEVRENDLLVGKITPKGETELTPEERLLRSIFAEKARDVKDSSLRIGKGQDGRIINVRVFSRELGHNMESGIIKKIIIEVAQMRNIQVGDKLAGRHGNKGVISIILPEEDMPYMEDGTPVDVVLTPLGIPSRMNLGQILELHLGMAAEKLGYQAVVPAFGGATDKEIRDELETAGFARDGRVTLIDGRTGDKFDQDIAVGYMYILKLHHMIEDKMHARSIGPYSLITQQPLGGKAQNGGQRFGEMEVWALEGYGASHTLREMITIKSDDIVGRSEAFDSIIRGEKIKEPHTPASFNVMMNYLRGLALDVELNVNEDNK